MLVHSDEILRLIVQNRQAWIKGFTGSHKTSLAYRLGYELIKRKEVSYLYTNNYCVWADDITDQHDIIDAVIVLDEGGLYVDNKQEVREFVALSNKLNVIYLIPSYEAPPRGMQQLKIYLRDNIINSGLPILIYRWEALIGGEKEKGLFGWINPAEIYGIYSRQAPGNRTNKLLEEVKRITKEFYQKYGQDQSIKPVDISWREITETIEKIMEKQ